MIELFFQFLAIDAALSFVAYHVSSGFRELVDEALGVLRFVISEWWRSK